MIVIATNVFGVGAGFEMARAETYAFRLPLALEKLAGDLSGAYAPQINTQNRLVCEVLAKARVVRVLRLWTHYE